MSVMIFVLTGHQLILILVVMALIPKAMCSSIPDAVLLDNGTIPVYSVFQYENNEGGGINETKLKTTQACYHKEKSKEKTLAERENKGTYHTVTFGNMKQAILSVLDNFSSKTQTIPVLLQTQWLVVNTTQYNDLVRAFSESTVLNITLKTSVDLTSRTKCVAEDETVIIDERWCKWAKVFAHHKNKIDGLPQYDHDGDCTINRINQARHFMNMWNIGHSKNYMAQCMDKKKKYANGKGQITQLQMGKAFGEDGALTHYDVNVTIEFKSWTDDFAQVFTDSHKKCLYYGNDTQLEVHLFLKDRVARQLPAQFYTFIVVAAFLGLVVTILFTLILCTCSTKSFRLEVWRYWAHKKAYEKYAREHSSELSELAADKRMEKIEAMMSTIVPDMNG